MGFQDKLDGIVAKNNSLLCVLVVITPDSVQLTYLGKLLADEVGQQFYSDTMKRRMSLIDPALVSTTWPQFNP